MTSAAPIDRLRRVLDALERGGPVPPDEAAWLLEGGRRYLAEAPNGITLDKALQLAPRRGQRHWWTIEKHEERDRGFRTYRREGRSLEESILEIQAEARRARPPAALARVPGRKRLRQILAGNQ